MRILMAHNHYQQAGGEDAVFDNEVRLLRSAGHTVETLAVSNDTIQGAVARARTALMTPYNPFGRAQMAKRIAATRPDVVHVHNFFPRLSPAIFDACQAAGVPAVWTLHNFRVACASGFFMRDGQICDACLGKAPIPAIIHRCYRGSLIGSASLAAMIALHRAMGTWQHKVTRFIALTNFARDMFVAAGLSPERIVVKPNFAYDPRTGSEQSEQRRHGALFVGRLSPEKGAGVLIDAWRDLDVPLTIIGDGPERANLERIAPPNVFFMGLVNQKAVAAAMADAQALIVPSVWFENFPMTVVEAMAAGTPVIASRLGALSGMVSDGVTGLHFSAGDADDLARVVTAAFAAPEYLARMGAGARQHWQTHLSPEANLRQMEGIYEAAVAEATSR